MLLYGITDSFDDKLNAGLKPFIVEIILVQGRFDRADVKLCWPPLPTEGPVEIREEYQKHFVWAQSLSDAKLRAVQLLKNVKHPAACETEEAEVMG